MNNERIEEIDKENIILVIFVGIIILAYIANLIEKRYFRYGNDSDRRDYYYVQSSIFIIVVILNIYYVYNSYMVVSNLSPDISEESKRYAYLDFVASVIALVAGLILLYIAITDTNLESEISI